MNDQDTNLASSYWDENVKHHDKQSIPASWLDSPLAQKYSLNKLWADEKNISIIQWVLWVKNKFVPSSTLDFGLSFGCGDGTTERQALALKICSRFDAFDVSPKSIEAAANKAKEQGFAECINYYVADFNSIVLEPNKYDIILSSMALHHLSNLEYALSELKKSLKPNGLLVLIEFVGPSQFQWPDKQVNVINDILNVLPERLRRDVISDTLKDQCARPSIEWMNTHDPSEAIRSAEILPLISQSWTIVERIDFGGAISQLLFDRIAGNFDPTKEEDVTIFRLIEYIDEILMLEKVLSSDFTIIVARKESEKHHPLDKAISATTALCPPPSRFKQLRISLKEIGIAATARRVLAYVKRRVSGANHS